MLLLNSQTLYPSEERVPLLSIPLIPSPLIPSIKVRVEIPGFTGMSEKTGFESSVGRGYYPHSSDRKPEAPRI